MILNNVVLEDWAYELSPTVLSSSDIENRLAPIYEKLKLPEGRLELMTGIRERRVWDVGTAPSTLSALAANKLIEQNPNYRHETDLLIHASVCRDFLEPATASVVHEKLQLPATATFFDLSNACLGVMNAIVVAGKMIEAGAIKRAMIVSGENSAPLLEATINRILTDETINRKNIKKLFANLTIGSAAVALTLTHESLAKKGVKLLGGAIRSDSSANHLCRGDGSPHALTMETDSEALMAAGIKLAKETWQECKAKLQLDVRDSFKVIGHQVGTAHEKLTMQSLELSHQPTFVTYPHLGNTGSAALPITFMQMMESDMKLQSKEKLMMLGIGSGLQSIMLGVEQ